MMKNKLLPFLFFAITTLHAQIDSSAIDKKLYIKANALFLPVGIVNAGLEYQLNEKFTLQGDVFISPWKSFDSRPAQLYMMAIEPRYYFKEAFHHWYVGLNVSAARFILQKWNYWPNEPYYYPNVPVYIKSDLYQDGFSFLAGATVGYQFQLGEKWNMDLFLGGGYNHSFYKGYHKELGVRYDRAKGWNKSGEWIPYRGGVMISYQLK